MSNQISGCCIVNGAVDSSFVSKAQCETIVYGCEESMGPWDSGVGPHPPCPVGWVDKYEDWDTEQRYKYCYQYSYKIFDGITCNCPSYSSTNPWYGKWPGSDGLTGFNLYIDPSQIGNSSTGPGPNATFVSNSSCYDLPQRVWASPCPSNQCTGVVIPPVDNKIRYFNQPIEQIPEYECTTPQILTHGVGCGLSWFNLDQCLEVVTCLSLESDRLKVTRNKIVVLKDFGPSSGPCDIDMNECSNPYNPSPSP